MKALGIVLGVVFFLVVFPAGCALATYNGLVTRQEGVAGCWGNVENAYQRRADLVPNMVETVKGYAAHESSVLTEVTRARASVGQVKIDPSKMTEQDLKRFDAMQSSLSGALQRLLVVSEQYPNLKADSAFADLRATLEGSENRIARERQLFNDATRDYNAAARRFPGSLFSFPARPYFAAAEASKTVPAVNFTGAPK